jgi:hypothetical protein
MTAKGESMTRKIIVLGLSALLLGSAAAVARPAGPGGTGGLWTRVTDSNGRNIDQVGLARTRDGVLHVFWERRAAPLSEGIWRTPVSPAGKPGAPTAVLDGFRGVGPPDAVVLPDGRLRTFFMGLGSSFGHGGVVSAGAPASASNWTRDGVRVSSNWGAVGPVGAAVIAAGAPVFAYGMSFVLGLHVGLDPNVADANLAPDRRCCDYLPDLATDAAAGGTFVAWYSNATDRTGIWVQQVAPSVAARQLAPGSATGGRSIVHDQRTAIASRAGGGVYLAYCRGYPSCADALLWRIGAPAPLRVGSGRDIEDVNISAAPEGRLWVMWHDGRSKRLHAARTNKAATRVGRVVTFAPPAGTTSVWKLAGEGSLGPLDVLANVSTPSSIAMWHTRVLPRLTLTASVAKGTRTVTFRVTDAGDPVGGATVRVAGKTLTTNAAGQAATKLSAGRIVAKATSTGYGAAAARVVVR